jgi:methionine synthase I (cobalamin-dependent)
MVLDGAYGTAIQARGLEGDDYRGERLLTTPATSPATRTS